jgi:hypothetical protein
VSTALQAGDDANMVTVFPNLMFAHEHIVRRQTHHPHTGFEEKYRHPVATEAPARPRDLPTPNNEAVSCRLRQASSDLHHAST